MAPSMTLNTELYTSDDKAAATDATVAESCRTRSRDRPRTTVAFRFLRCAWAVTVRPVQPSFRRLPVRASRLATQGSLAPRTRTASPVPPQAKALW